MFPNATATGTRPAELFVLTPSVGFSTSVVVPGSNAIVQSVATGMYCRVVAGTTAGTEQIKCDQATPATATPMTYTGSGLVYNGLLLGTSASAQKKKKKKPSYTSRSASAMGPRTRAGG